MENYTKKYAAGIFTLGVASVLLILLNSFSTMKETNRFSDVRYLSFRDSIVSLIDDFDRYENQTWEKLQAVDIKNDYKTFGQTNFYRARLQQHSKALKELLSEWQTAGWPADSVRLDSIYAELENEITHTRNVIARAGTGM